jgi:hypothetical protein
MNETLAILGAAGGAVVFVGAIVTVARGIFRQVASTDANTAALDRLNGTLENHETRISRLEGRSEIRAGVRQ